MIDIDAREKMIWFSKSFNEQMAWIDEKVDNIIKHDSKKGIQERGREAYGEPSCASSIKSLFEIIKADPKNRALMHEICQAERELIAFLYDEPNAPSEQELLAYWRKYFDAYIAEIEQSPSLYYLLVKTPAGGGRGEVLGVYRSVGILKTAYDKAVRELEKEQKDNKTSKKILINSFDEKNNEWQYDIDTKQLFGSKHAEKGKASIIIECVMDSPYMYEWKQEKVAKDINGYICSDNVRASSNDESILVRFDVEHTYETLDKLGRYWGSWNSCPDWQTMRDISPKCHKEYDAELIMIAHDALKFQCRRLTEEAAEIIAEANSLTAEVINSEHELNKNLSGKTEFTLWWD